MSALSYWSLDSGLQRWYSCCRCCCHCYCCCSLQYCFEILMQIIVLLCRVTYFLFQCLVMCFRLNFAKDPIVINTASATVRQMVNCVYERVIQVASFQNLLFFIYLMFFLDITKLVQCRFMMSFVLTMCYREVTYVVSHCAVSDISFIPHRLNPLCLGYFVFICQKKWFGRWERIYGNLELFAVIFSINDGNDFFKEDGLKGCEMPIVHQTVRVHAKAPPPTLRPCASDGYMLFHVSPIFFHAWFEKHRGWYDGYIFITPKYSFFFFLLLHLFFFTFFFLILLILMFSSLYFLDHTVFVGLGKQCWTVPFQDVRCLWSP